MTKPLTDILASAMLKAGVNPSVEQLDLIRNEIRHELAQVFTVTQTLAELEELSLIQHITDPETTKVNLPSPAGHIQKLFRLLFPTRMGKTKERVSE